MATCSIHDCAPPSLRKLRSHGAEEACRRRPGYWNILAYEREAKRCPDSTDFLSSRSPNYHLKAVERDLYLGLLDPHLRRLGPRSRVLDAGGGIGRMALPLAARGHRVTLADGSRTALRLAQRHARRRNLQARLSLCWADVEDLSRFGEGEFDTTLGVEVLPYCTRPARALREMARVTRRRGLLFLSVEGQAGRLWSGGDPGSLLGPAARAGVTREGDLHVRYYSAEEFRRLLEGEGLRVLSLQGCHYVLEGVFHPWLKESRLRSREYRRRILRVERGFSAHPGLACLARVWVAVAQRK